MKKFLFAGSLMLVTGFAHAANVTQVGQYATVDNKPLAAQINPLMTVQQIHFPQNVKTVGEAMSYWLQYSGFALSQEAKDSAALSIVMSRPLPQVVRNLGPLTVAEGLEVLAGKTVFTMKDNPLTREVSFYLNPQFAKAMPQQKGAKV